jgi:REP element-mobilizing transposase RayT
MGNTLGYMVTWTTYGTWLQGDERGWVKKGKILEASKGLEQANKESLSGDGFKLKKGQREVVRTAIVQEAERIGEKVLAMSVWSNHVHVVIEGGGKPMDKVVNRLKSAAYYALRERGVEGRVWTRGFDKRFCFSEEELNARIEYVNKHGQ